jgi:hypothetical protein
VVLPCRFTTRVPGLCSSSSHPASFHSPVVRMRVARQQPPAAHQHFSAALRR